jgi:septal ring factor EnvC (AmiA/AmiB activator)
MEEDYYLDERGYKRYKKDGKLVHRDIAFLEVYRKSRHSFPKRFSEYDVHHMDGNKLNNLPSNLSLKPRETHKLTHEVKSVEEQLKNLKQGSAEFEKELSSLKIKKEILWDKTVGDICS